MHVTRVVVASCQDSESVPTSADTNWRSLRDMQYMLQGQGIIARITPMQCAGEGGCMGYICRNGMKVAPFLGTHQS